MSARPRLLVVGMTPPPVHGTSAFVRMLLDAPAVRERFQVLHLDTADRRGLENIGRLDATNVALALRHVAELAGLMRRERPALVYVPVAQNALAWARDGLFVLAGRQAGARVVTHLHTGGFGEFFGQALPWTKGWVRHAQGRAHRAWVLADSLRGGYRGVLPAARVRVVPNGVPDPLDALPAGEQEVDLRVRRTSTPPDILFLGQLSTAKGVDDLLEAARELVRQGLEFRLVLAGSWASAAERESTVAGLAGSGLAERVRLAGVLTGAEKARAFGDAAFFVLPSRLAEGQPLAILEAMAAGLPVVATSRGGIPDLVREGETGLLVPAGDPGALGAALARLLTDPAGARRMGEAGRRRWEERYTVERCMERVAGLFEEALDDAGVEVGVAAAVLGAGG